MLQNFICRKGERRDALSIVQFQIDMARETEALELDREILEKGVAAVFDDPHKGHYWVAEHEGKVVGSLLLLSEWSDWRNGFVWWIHSVFVIPNYRGKGVYKSLFHKIQEVIRQDPQSHGLRLYVEKENTQAQAVYSKLGMDGEHYRLFQWMKTF